MTVVRVWFFIAFFPSFAIVAIDVAILAHTVGVKFVMGAVPGFFVTAVFVVTVTAHALCIVLLLRVSAVVGLFSELYTIIHFLLSRFNFYLWLGLLLKR